MALADVEHFVDALEQFRNPRALAYHVGKDLVVNGHDIFVQLNAAVAAYQGQRFEEFGVHLGTALRKLIIGEEVEVVPPADRRGIALGLVEGFLGDSAELKACVKDGSIDMGDIDEAVKDFEKKTREGLLAGLKKLSEACEALPQELRECKVAEADVERLADALKRIHDPKDFVYHMGKDLLVNGKDIFREVNAAVGAYKAQRFEEFGVDVGTALRKLVVGDAGSLRQPEQGLIV